jgi:hypothetical protein
MVEEIAMAEFSVKNMVDAVPECIENGFLVNGYIRINILVIKRKYLEK